MKRWSIEETIQFVKQTYGLENIRVIKYVRLQNISFVIGCIYFVAIMLDQKQKLTSSFFFLLIPVNNHIIQTGIIESPSIFFELFNIGLKGILKGDII